MQNPFVQLRKYNPDVNDPSENRATETLAACLVLSEQFRRIFLQFLFNGKVPCDSMNMATCEISTQQTTTRGRIVDLLMEQKDEWSIVVEVKVRAPEDGAQIKEYRDWLDETKGRKNYVFHLVKSHERNFRIADHGGEGTRTWKELYDYLSRSTQNEAGTTDANLVQHFCGYLEVEGIVSTWKPEDILPYAKGLSAMRALKNLFEQVEGRLKDLNLDYQTEIVMPHTDDWPRLGVGRESWKGLVGEKSRLTKVWACYQTHDYSDPAWPWHLPLGGELPRFYFQIVLWAEWQEDNWELIHPRIPACVRMLQEQRFVVWAWPKRRGALKIATDENKFDELEPIGSCSLDTKVALITHDQLRAMAADRLVDDIYRRTLQHCEIFTWLCEKVCSAP